MSDHTELTGHQPELRAARDWIKVLAKYREPNTSRSTYELAVTIGPFLSLWVLAWWSLSVSYWLTLAISSVNAAFLLRLFCIQHDCGHGAFFNNRTVSDWLVSRHWLLESMVDNRTSGKAGQTSEKKAKQATNVRKA